MIAYGRHVVLTTDITEKIFAYCVVICAYWVEINVFTSNVYYEKLSYLYICHWKGKWPRSSAVTWYHCLKRHSFNIRHHFSSPVCLTEYSPRCYNVTTSRVIWFHQRIKYSWIICWPKNLSPPKRTVLIFTWLVFRFVLYTFYHLLCILDKFCQV